MTFSTATVKLTNYTQSDYIPVTVARTHDKRDILRDLRGRNQTDDRLIQTTTCKDTDLGHIETLIKTLKINHSMNLDSTN